MSLRERAMAMAEEPDYPTEDANPEDLTPWQLGYAAAMNYDPKFYKAIYHRPNPTHYSEIFILRAKVHYWEIQTQRPKMSSDEVEQILESPVLRAKYLTKNGDDILAFDSMEWEGFSYIIIFYLTIMCIENVKTIKAAIHYLRQHWFITRMK